MSDAFLTDAAKQVPVLAVLTFMVVSFLKYLQALTTSHLEQTRAVHEQHERNLKSLIDRYDATVQRLQATDEKMWERLVNFERISEPYRSRTNHGES